MGPVPLTEASVLGEMRKGLGGYLYIKCQNSDCGAVIRVPNGYIHQIKKTGSHGLLQT